MHYRNGSHAGKAEAPTPEASLAAGRRRIGRAKRGAGGGQGARVKRLRLGILPLVRQRRRQDIEVGRHHAVFLAAGTLIEYQRLSEERNRLGGLAQLLVQRSKQR
jgi:hypothetical protein